MRAIPAEVVAVALLLCGNTVMAQQPTSDVDCSTGRGSQAEINRCAAMEAERAKNSLNDLLAALKVKLPSSRWEELQAVQSEWRRFADHHCRWDASFSEGGSVAPAVGSLCEHTLTRQRIDVLKVFLCEGQGMTGPCEASKRF